MSFQRLGYDFTNEENMECFNNLILLYDKNDLFWITCNDESIDNPTDYFNDNDYFIMSFSLLQKEKDENKYNLTYATNITYENILEDIKDNKLDKKVKIKFDKEFYDKNRKFEIVAKNFDDVKNKLKDKLKSFEIKMR